VTASSQKLSSNCATQVLVVRPVKRDHATLLSALSFTTNVTLLSLLPLRPSLLPSLLPSVLASSINLCSVILLAASSSTLLLASALIPSSLALVSTRLAFSILRSSRTLNSSNASTNSLCLVANCASTISFASLVLCNCLLSLSTVSSNSCFSSLLLRISTIASSYLRSASLSRLFKSSNSSFLIPSCALSLAPQPQYPRSCFGGL